MAIDLGRSLIDNISNICNNNIVNIGGDDMGKRTISATIDEKLFKRLNDLCDETERKRSWLIERSIETYLDELEDVKIAKERLNDERLSAASLKKAIGV